MTVRHHTICVMHYQTGCVTKVRYASTRGMRHPLHDCQAIRCSATPTVRYNTYQVQCNKIHRRNTHAGGSSMLHLWKEAPYNADNTTHMFSGTCRVLPMHCKGLELVAPETSLPTNRHAA
jgi:hypothetical protein